MKLPSKKQVKKCLKLADDLASITVGVPLIAGIVVYVLIGDAWRTYKTGHYSGVPPT